MGFAAKMIAMLIARFKGLGFLEWAGIASLADTILTYDVKQQMFALVCEYAAKGAGLELNKDDPFSDESLSNAVSIRMGITVRSLKDPDKIREDVDSYAAALISDKSGYAITSVTNSATLRYDIERVGAAILSERVGLPVGIFEPGQGVDGDVIRERLLQWAEAEIMTRAAAKASAAAERLVAESNIEAIAAQINGRLGAVGSSEIVTALQIANKISIDLAAGAVANFGRVAQKMDKKSRRRELNRAAQARFRAVHGNRQIYVPLNMNADVS